MTEKEKVLMCTAAVIIGATTIAVCALPTLGRANGLGESRPWQFQTSADRANKASVLDLIERKRGGYYDGFATVVYSTSTTNIGSQINCNTVADTNANIADNSQGGNTTSLNPDGSLESVSSGNSSGYAGTEESGTATNNQENTGAVAATVDGSVVSSATGDVTAGSTANDMLNSQENSGDLSASVSDAITCDMSGANLEGWIDITTGDVSTGGAPLN